METAVFRESRRQAAVRLAGSTALLVASLWLATGTPLVEVAPDRADYVVFIGWVGALFFGLLSLRYAWALASPGELTISSFGIEQNLGWRRKRWRWSDIEDVRLGKTAVPVCIVYPAAGLPVRLFGWNVHPQELKRHIDEHRLHLVEI